MTGNGHLFAQKPLSDGGTSQHAWTDWGRTFPELDLAECPGLILVAPHPDDETLGLGATAARLQEAGVEVLVVAVTDGGAAFGERSSELERTRRFELRQATGILGLPEPIGLGLPDGRVAEFEEQLTVALVELLRSRPEGTWCAATWRGDGHPDHEAVGRAAAAAAEAVGSRLLEYPVWMWHWAEPGHDAVPWGRAASVPMSVSAVERKKAAAQAFRSQFESDDPLLPPYVLPRLLAVGEVVFT